MQAVRALGRFRWMLPAVAIPLCIAALGLAVQAVGFPRPAPETLVAADALRTIEHLSVMRGIQRIGARPVASICLDVSFRVPTRRDSIHGALVLLGNGERLYNFGKGVRSVGEKGPVGPVDRARFVLAGCPSSLGQGIASSLARNLPVDADRLATGQGQTLAMAFGPSYRLITLLLNGRVLRPVAVALGGRVPGSSRLNPGASQAAIMRVRRTFTLGGQTPTAGD
jgi:hypothetical protein